MRLTRMPLAVGSYGALESRSQHRVDWIRTSEPPRPKRGALTRLSYAPSSLEGPHSMAVGAPWIAPFDLGQHQILTAEPHEVADVSALLASRPDGRRSSPRGGRDARS